MVKQLVYTVGDNPCQVVLTVSLTEDGIVAQLYGGHRPHVGAVALSLPRPSLAQKETLSCNTSVLPLLGHKDDEIAKPIAEQIAKAFNQPTVVVAGLHVDNATTAIIETLLANSHAAAGLLIKENCI